ncbi:MAG TPA: hypothetical protein VJZ91_10005 [Blastocatellia bacterium]|nr:hypothetical protein [Blastocatellia bacterium]
MMNRLTAVALALLLWSAPLVTRSQTAPRSAAAPGVKTDRRVYAEPAPPALPAAGGTLVDPVFGTTILRVTDERDGKSNETPYSYWPSFNKDATRLYVKSDDQSILFGFDPDNFGVTTRRKLFQRALPEGGYPWTDDVIWSGTDNNTVFCHSGLRLYSYNVVMNNYELVHDFAGQVPGDTIWQMSRSLDDDTFGFHLKSSRNNYKVVGYAAWKRSTNSLYAANEPQVNEVQVDKTGRYLVVTMELPDPQPTPPASGVEVRVVDLQTKQITDLKDGGPDFAPGHHDCGRGVVVGHDNWNNRLTFRRLDGAHQFVSAITFGNDWSLGNHVSLLADDENWALVSTFVANTYPNSGVFKDELFLVATDGSGRVRRIAHHHSVFRDYADTPRANLSRDGRFAAFTSNWGSPSRRDVFVVRIPPPGGRERYETTPPPDTPAGAPSSAASHSSIRNVTPRSATPQTLPPVASASPSSSPATSSLPAPATANFGAAQPVTWTALLNCAVSGNSLQKTAGSESLADAEARSAQRIRNGDGYVEFTASEAGKTRMVGLAHDSAELNFASVDFAIKLTAKGVAEVRENNAYASETPYAAGDVFRIAVENRQVKYYQNGKPFFTSLNTPADTLFAKAVLVHLGARVSNVVMAAGK